MDINILSLLVEPPEFEVLIRNTKQYSWRMTELIQGTGLQWQDLKRNKKQYQGSFVIADEKQLIQILHNLFIELDPEDENLCFDGQEFVPALSIIGNIPEELIGIIPPIYAKYQEKKDLEKERRRQDEIRRAKEIAERLEREAAERKAAEEAARKAEEARKARLRLLEMPIPEEVLWLQPDAPDWLVEKVWKILRSELHPDRFQHKGNGIHKEMEKVFMDVSEAFDLIKETRKSDWNPATPLQLMEKSK
jgi:hypothetical protein